MGKRKTESAHGFEPLLTRPEAAELLNVSIRTVRRQIDEGLLPVVRIGGSVRIRAADLRAFVARMTEGDRRDLLRHEFFLVISRQYETTTSSSGPPSGSCDTS